MWLHICSLLSLSIEKMTWVISNVPRGMCYYIETSRLCRLLILSFILLFYCEFVHYYAVLLQCTWPELQYRQFDTTVPPGKDKPLKVMFLADTHLLGFREGHWFDKLRREWQMERSFRTTMTIHNPEVVFVLGDLLDEGKWCGNPEFDYHVKRFKSMFQTPFGTDTHVIVGNHDIGFHHAMAMEGDGCSLCSEAERDLHKIRDELKCIQHFPMFRPSDANCTVPDAAPDNIKNVPFKEAYDCLSKKSTKQLFNWINPRLVVSAHTHHGCYLVHSNHIPEWTVASFSWRNKRNPSFLLAVISNNNFAVSQCHLPDEWTVITIYIVGGVITLIIFLLPRKSLRKGFSKHS